MNCELTGEPHLAYNPRMSLTEGSVLKDRYRIEGQLGKGGMGAVYRAYDQTLEIQVAVKENLNLNPESERQFKREANLLASLRHPNLPRVTDHFVLEGRQYLVMDYIEGEDLQTRITRSPPSAAEILRWSDDICDALTYLHTRTPPVIHRDIKPANLKLQPDGRVILVDFGIAKSQDQTQTATGARGLTPGFSPPEQYGGSTTDARSDQYALAATIYALFTRKPPANSIDRMLKKEQLQSPQVVNPEVPEHIQSTLVRALELGQDQRFPNVATFKAALHGESDALTRLGAGVVAARKPRRAPVALLAGLGGIGILAVAGVGFLLISGGLRAEAEPTAAPTLAVVAPVASDTPIPSPTFTTVAETTSEVPEPTPTREPSPTPIQSFAGGGGRIAFVSDRAENVLQIWTMNPDGSDPRQLTFDPGDKTYPSWSPDGTRLLYTAPGPTGMGLDIFVINADGTGIAPVVSHEGEDYDAVWSPDGSQIAFTSTRVNNVMQVFLLEAACLDQPDGCTGVRPRNISCHEEFCAVESSPAWAPEGMDYPDWLPSTHNLAVTVSINQAPPQIFVRPPEAVVPIDFDRRDEVIGVEDLSWSPDGSLFLFTWYFQRGSNEIYIAPVADRGATHTKLTNTNGNKEAVFSPDGLLIAFTSTRDGKPEIYLMNAGGGNQINLSNSGASRDMQPAWQP